MSAPTLTAGELPSDSEAGAERARVHLVAAILILAYVVLYRLTLSQRPLFTPDEMRYAEVSREMSATADWVVPRLAGVRYFEKPPLGYWLNALAQSVFGENRFAVRLPSAISAGLTALLVVAFTRRMTGRTSTGLFAAAVYLSFVEVYVIGTFNVLDGILALFLTAAIMAFHRACTASRPAEQYRFALAAGVAAGGAFLTKGLLGLAVPAMVLAPWLAWERMLPRGVKPALIAAVGTILVAGPWSWMIHVQEGDFWRYFFWEEHVRRFLADNAQHRRPPHFYLALLPLLAFPWLAWLPAAVSGYRQAPRARARSEWRLVVLWIIVPFVFFSASRGKLITYILPCFPALAVLVAAGLSVYMSGRGRGLLKLGAGINAGVLLVGMALALALLSGRMDAMLFRASEPGLVLVAGAMLLGAAAGMLVVAGNPHWVSAAAAVMVVVPLMLVTPFCIPQALLERKASGLLLARFAPRIDARTVLVTDSGMIRAVAWFFKRGDVYVTSAGELAYGLAYPDAADRLLKRQDLKKLVATSAGANDVVLICKRSCRSRDLELLPAHAVRFSYGRFELWHAAGG